MTPHRLTIASIRIQGVDEDQSRHYLAAVYHCGCYDKRGEWSLCQYHEGFEDGIDAIEQAQKVAS